MDHGIMGPLKVNGFAFDLSDTFTPIHHHGVLVHRFKPCRLSSSIPRQERLILGNCEVIFAQAPSV
jgi:hypothetical protein